MARASDAVLSFFGCLAFVAAATALVITARGITAKAKRARKDLERRRAEMVEEADKLSESWWQSRCTLLRQPGSAHWYTQNLSIPLGGFRGQERVEVKVVRCEASVEYTGSATLPPGRVEANVFASFNFAERPVEELCESVLDGETWPNIELDMPGLPTPSWACGNATYVHCDWWGLASLTPARDCRTQFGTGPNETAFSSSHCWTSGWWSQSTTCFERLWARRCPLPLTVGTPVPCLVDRHGQVRIGTLETLAVELAGGLPSRTWHFGMVSLEEAALPWWLYGAAAICLLLALACLCTSLILCRQLSRPIFLKQDLELESREIAQKVTQKVTRFGVAMKRLDIKMDNYGKERPGKQQHPGGEAFGFLGESKCCRKSCKTRLPEAPRTLREELTDEQQALLPAG